MVQSVSVFNREAPSKNYIHSYANCDGETSDTEAEHRVKTSTYFRLYAVESLVSM